MPSDDTPLVIESGNELPARYEFRVIIIGFVMRVERPQPAGLGQPETVRHTSTVQP